MTKNPSKKPIRLAMWSGPRNISTAMMRSWGNRPDTIVCDEPLYAHYLAVTGKNHPGSAEVITHGPVNANDAIHSLLAPLPSGKIVFFQKHMAHHLLADIDGDWLNQLTHCFLIRDPRQVIASYIKHVESPTLEDTGFPQQANLFDRIKKKTGKTPPVLDARDVLENPRAILTNLCQTLDLPFTESMLAWPPGLRDTDGVWAKHWYQEVETTTGFRPYKPKPITIPENLAPLLASCQEFYDHLYPHRLRA